MIHFKKPQVSYHIFARKEQWDACRDIAEALVEAKPDDATAWLHLSYTTRRATGGGVQAAWDVLSTVGHKFLNVPTVSYNLACYACQLGDLKLAWKWLEQAFDVGDPRALKLMALDDPDLERLWLDIAEI